jgi:Fe-S cluster biogenesis protein NfuA
LASNENTTTGSGGAPAVVGGEAAAGGNAAAGGEVGDGVAGELETDFEKKVADVIAIIRPAIQADQGDIFLRAVDAETGVVSVELVGACITCPASSQTLKEGLERILKQRVEGVTSVEHVGEELIGADEGTRVSL